MAVELAIAPSPTQEALERYAASQGVVVHTMDQGSTEWYEQKCGKTSASVAHELLTPTFRPSASRTAQIARLVAERILGFNEAELDDMVQTYWMERGHEIEDRARAAFELETGFQVVQVGGVEKDGAWVSPDGLVLINDTVRATLEIKCPAPKQHVLNWIAGRDGEVPAKYLPQIHAAMAISGLETCHFVSFCPGFPLVHLQVHRDERTDSMQDAICDTTRAVDELVAEMERQLVRPE